MYRNLILVPSILSLLAGSGLAQESLADVIRPLEVEVRFRSMRKLDQEALDEIRRPDRVARFFVGKVEAEPDVVLTLRDFEAKQLGRRSVPYTNEKGDRVTLKFTSAAASVECLLETPSGERLGEWTDAFWASAPYAISQKDVDRDRDVSKGDARNIVLESALGRTIARGVSQRLFSSREEIPGWIAKASAEQLEGLAIMLGVSEARYALALIITGAVESALAAKPSDAVRERLWDCLRATHGARSVPETTPTEADEVARVLRELRRSCQLVQARARTAIAARSRTPTKSRAPGAVELLLVSEEPVDLGSPTLVWSGELLERHLSSTRPGDGIWKPLTRKMKEPTLVLLQRRNEGRSHKPVYKFDEFGRGPATPEQLDVLLLGLHRLTSDRMHENARSLSAVRRLLD